MGSKGNGHLNTEAEVEDHGEKGQDQLLSGSGGCGGKEGDLPAQTLRRGDREE